MQATMTTTPVKPVTASLVLKINGVNYSIRPIPCASVFGSAAFHLTKTSGDRAEYDVLAADTGAECTCADFEFKRNGLDPAGCKHIRPLRIVGLFPALAATPDPMHETCVVCGESLTADESEMCRRCVESIRLPGEDEAEDIEDDASEDDASEDSFHDDLFKALPALDAPGEDDQDEAMWNAIAVEPIGWEKPARKSYFLPTSPRPVKPSAIPDGKYSLLDLVEAQVALLRGQDSAVHNLMADTLADLARSIRHTGANSVAEFTDRIAVMDTERLDRLQYDAFAEGFAQAERQAMDECR